MRMVKIIMLIFCTVVLFAPQAAQSAKTTDDQAYSVPKHYTSPSGITKHYTPEMQMMHRQRMMMKKGLPYQHQMSSQYMSSKCPMCAKLQAANLTPEMRAHLMMTLTEFSIQNQPMFDELKRLKQERAALKRIKSTTPEELVTIEMKRENVRCALMKNLKKQRAILKQRFNLDITEREMLMHKLHQMKMPSPVCPGMTSGQPMHMNTKKMPQSYRPPQQTNPNYNQDYLRNAPIREGYTGQTYE